MSTQKESIFEEAKDWLAKELHIGQSIESKIAAYANTVTNELKTLEDNPTVEFFGNAAISIAEASFPELKPFITGIEVELPKVLAFLAGVETVTPTQWAAYLKKATGIDLTTYAGILGTVAGFINKFVSDKANKGITPAEALVVQQLAHK